MESPSDIVYGTLHIMATLRVPPEFPRDTGPIHRVYALFASVFDRRFETMVSLTKRMKAARRR